MELGGTRASRECEFAGPQDLPGVTGPGAELPPRSEGMHGAPLRRLTSLSGELGVTRSYES